MGEIAEYYSDVRNYRKKHREKNPPRRRCWDWMIVSGNHYAKNRSFFKTYHSIRKVKLSSGDEVVGFGTVELRVLRAPEETEVRTLVLDNVLHIPKAICNGFSQQLITCNTSYRPFSQGFDEENRPLWYGTQFCGLSKLALPGTPEGESKLQEERQKGTLFSLSLFLSTEDTKKLATSGWKLE